MTNEALLLLVLIVVILGVLPAWPYSSAWGYGPTGALAVILVVFLVWAAVQERPLFSSAGHDLKDTAQEAGRDLKEAGRDAASAIRDTVD